MNPLLRLAALTAALIIHAVPSSARPLMSAVRIHDFGGPEVLRVDEVPRPSAGAGEVLVRNRAAGINPVDWKIREGMLRGRVTLPMTLGFDVSGVVESVGDGVTDFNPGDEVFAYLSLTRGGGYAQYAAIPVAELARKPASIDHTHAAGVPLAALTAWQALIDTAGLLPGQTVLIHGGSGGVGHFAVQIAKARGARVIATASAANLEFLREIGADEAIDYRARRFEEIARDVDIVLDSVGGETQARSYSVLKKGGFLVSIVQPPDPALLEKHGVRGKVILVQPSGEQLALIAALIDEGRIRPHVGATFPLAEASAAHELSKAGGTRGKIVLTVD